jgi:hypothetical protein
MIKTIPSKFLNSREKRDNVNARLDKIKRAIGSEDKPNLRPFFSNNLPDTNVFIINSMDFVMPKNNPKNLPKVLMSKSLKKVLEALKKE